MAAMLSVRSLYKSFRTGLFSDSRRNILEDVTFDIQEGEILGMTGASGSGKSTLIRCIMRLIPADSGQILLDGTDLLSLSSGEMQEKRKEMQMVFQNPVSALNPRKRIFESMQEPFLIHNLFEDSKKEITVMFEKLRLRRELLDRFPHQVSGGELQRICLGRILLLRPKLLLLDEPTSMLDVSVQAQIVAILREIRQDYPITLFFVSHDLALLKAVCDRIGVMRHGRLVELQTAEILFRHPENQYTRDLISAFNEF